MPIRKAAAAGIGKRISGGISKGVSSGRSSGAKGMAFAKRHKVGVSVVGGGLVGGTALGRTRRSGLDKTRGRPTGMYNY
jgi:hypothetical protein